MSATLIRTQLESAPPKTFSISATAEEYKAFQELKRAGKIDASIAEKKSRTDTGLDSLQVAVDWALNEHSAAAEVFAGLLASLYNDSRAPLKISGLIYTLDSQNFAHAMNVIQLCRDTHQEPHTFFAEGNALFEKIIKRWKLETKRRAA